MLNNPAPSTQWEGDGGMGVIQRGCLIDLQLVAGVALAGAAGGGDAGIGSPGFKMCLTSTLM